MAQISKIALISSVVHEMPRGRQRQDEGSAQITYSSKLTPLDADTDRFIREEMLIPSLSQAREIVEDTQGGRSPVPQLVREVLADGSSLMSASRTIADWMHKTQRSGSAGVFLCSIAEVEDLPRVVILKAEHQEGVRLLQTGEGDNVEFSVQHLNELIMGQNSRVHKIGMMWVDQGGDIRGLMVDKQNGVGFADYFLGEFLGCQLTHRAEVLTRDFVNTVESWVNSSPLSADKKQRYLTALAATLDSPAPKLKPNQFISEFIDAEDRDLLAEKLPSQSLAYEFSKDVSLVTSKVGGLRVRTSTGVTLNATADAVEKGDIQFRPHAPGGPEIAVRGTADQFNLSKGPRGN